MMNRARLNVFLIVSVCFLMTMLLLSLKIELLRPNCLMYGAGLVMCILLMKPAKALAVRSLGETAK